jgi:hypothetical protein
VELRDAVDFARTNRWSVLINLLRRPWAALHVTRQDFFAYAVLEGAVELSPDRAYGMLGLPRRSEAEQE